MKRLLTLLLTLALFTSAHAKTVETTGKISRVVVYRGQALVTREVSFEGGDTSIAIKIGNLPSNIIQNSLYATSSGKIKALSVQFKSEHITSDTRDEVRLLDEEIKKLETEWYHSHRNREYISAIWGDFQGLWKLSIDSVNAELNDGKFKADEVKDLATFLEEKHHSFHIESVELELEKKELDTKIKHLKDKRAKIAKGKSSMMRSAIVYLDGVSTGKQNSIQLSYLVNGANWSPQYNLRAQPQNNKLTLEYNATVSQQSGEDWTNAGIVLSTAQPHMTATPPEFDPIKIRLSHLGQSQQAKTRDGYQDQLMRNVWNRANYYKKGSTAAKELKQVSFDNQFFEFNSDMKAIAKFQDDFDAAMRLEGVSASYNISGKFSIPSRHDSQLIRIASINTDASFIHVAMPLMTDFVYLITEASNTSKYTLLPGPCSVFRNEEFSGTSQLPMIAKGESFSSGLGIEPQIKITRRLVDKKTNIQGGNKIDNLKYKLSLSNLMETKVNVKLLDRIPYVEDNSVNIDFISSSIELSKDKNYLATEKDKGILRWDIVLDSDATGLDSMEVDYEFRMEYDKNMLIQ